MTIGINEPAYRNIQFTTAQTNTVVKSFTGVLHAIVVNNVGSAGTITIADGATPIATIASPAVGTIFYNTYFNTNLTVSSGGATAPTFTVVYA
jgi:hypothetical protein